MKTRYRIIARRKIEAARRLRPGSSRGEVEQVCPEDPMEMPAELLELATEEPVSTKKKGR
jgi:hypothetical protein